MEDEVRVRKLIRFEPDRGRTGKGYVHFWAERGGYRCLDVEDIVTIARNPQMSRR